MLKFTQISKFQGQKGRGLSHVTHFYILGLLSISGVGKARDFKFGVRIDLEACKPRNAKVGQKGRGLRHVTYFYNFGTPFISLERTKLETSNLVCELIIWPAYTPKNPKAGQKGRGLRHMTYFLKFWDLLHISGMSRGRYFKFGAVWSPGLQTKTCKIRSKGAWPASHDVLLLFWNPLYLWNG